MPILKILEETPSLLLAPDDVAALVAAYESALLKLGLAHRDDPDTRMVAERIIAAAKQGERDPHKLRDAVVASWKAR